MLFGGFFEISSICASANDRSRPRPLVRPAAMVMNLRMRAPPGAWKKDALIVQSSSTEQREGRDC